MKIDLSKMSDKKDGGCETDRMSQEELKEFTEDSYQAILNSQKRVRGENNFF